MEMQHDARARLARRRKRAPAQRGLDVVGVHHARAGAPHGRGDVLRREAAAQQPERRPPAAEQRRVALEHLGLLAQLRPHQPCEVLDRALLAAGHAVAVVEQEDHRGEP